MLVAVANPGRVVVSLTVVGESVDPDEISELIGAPPDRSHQVGIRTHSEPRTRRPAINAYPAHSHVCPLARQSVRHRCRRRCHPATGAAAGVVGEYRIGVRTRLNLGLVHQRLSILMPARAQEPSVLTARPRSATG
jgi:hypothetical protein